MDIFELVFKGSHIGLCDGEPCGVKGCGDGDEVVEPFFVMDV
jgi:hypothetical protein